MHLAWHWKRQIIWRDRSIFIPQDCRFCLALTSLFTENVGKIHAKQVVYIMNVSTTVIHHSILQCANLYNAFPHGCIRNRGPINWPSRSPDWTPLDFSVGLSKGIWKTYQIEFVRPAILSRRLWLRLLPQGIITTVWSLHGARRSTV